MTDERQCQSHSNQWRHTIWQQSTNSHYTSWPFQYSSRWAGVFVYWYAMEMLFNFTLYPSKNTVLLLCNCYIKYILYTNQLLLTSAANAWHHILIWNQFYFCFLLNVRPSGSHVLWWFISIHHEAASCHLIVTQQSVYERLFLNHVL